MMVEALPLLQIVGGILLALAILLALTLLFLWAVLALAPGSRYKARLRDSRELRTSAERFARLQAEYDGRMDAGVSRRAS
jgi:hypothetical protein